MVSISSEASNLPGSNSYEQTDIDIPPTKLYANLQLSSHQYETQELEANTQPSSHISYISSTDSHRPANYNKLVYKSEEDSAG